MKFVWHMTERDWENFIHDSNIENETDFGGGFYGNCYVGYLCADVLHTLDQSDWYAYSNMFGLGIDDGYGETLKGNIPYSLLDSYVEVPVDCNSFEEFKKCFEKNFEECINLNEELKELADMPLGDWS